MKWHSCIIVLMICVIGMTNNAGAQSVDELIASGTKLNLKGNYEEALALFNQAIALDEGQMDAYLKRAFAYSALNRYQEAILDYNKIIATNPNAVLAYISRGSVYNKLEQYQEAIEDFTQVINLQPENSEAYNNRGWAKKGLGDKDGACDDWKTSKKMGNAEAKIILRNNQC
jgi:tetratricopeptide (TPR) repeat protein